MSQAYSNPVRATDPHALPDVEVFYLSDNAARAQMEDDPDHDFSYAGWYWHSCFPGCMPDSEPNGPFATEAEALADAQSKADGPQWDDDVGGSHINSADLMD